MNRLIRKEESVSEIRTSQSNNINNVISGIISMFENNHELLVTREGLTNPYIAHVNILTSIIEAKVIIKRSKVTIDPYDILSLKGIYLEEEICYGLIKLELRELILNALEAN